MNNSKEIKHDWIPHMKEGDPETSLMKKKRGAASLKKIVIPEKVVVSRYLSEEKLHQQMR